jgi:hypothetical protein
MTFIESILNNKLTEAKDKLFARLNEVASEKLTEAKGHIAHIVYEEVEDLDEGNIVKTGRVQRIKRRIRRNKQGRIILQRNVRRSAIKGYRLSGNTVKRIPAAQRLHKSRMLKRYWKTKGRSKMNRVLLKRKMSMRRRKSMGIK